MSGRRPDTEQAIRDWLADSAPDRAPASLGEALEDATSRPAGDARPWPRAGGQRSLLLVGRLAAALALLAILASGLYLYGNGRPTSTGPGSGSPSASTTPQVSASGTAGPRPSAASPLPRPTVVHLAGSSWRLVSGTFPRMVAPAWAQFEPTVFELSGNGGFVAFVPSPEGVASHRSGGAILAAFTTAGPTSPTSWETRVYRSTDGVTWTAQAFLPNDAATVTAVAEKGGRLVAVGWTGETPNTTATAWTTTDLLTWHANTLPVTPQSDTYSSVSGVAAGPAGFLAWGDAGASSLFWISPDGINWKAIAASGLPAEPLIDAVYGNAQGWEIAGELSDRSATWQSNLDGAVWTRAWTGPATSSTVGGHYLGPIFKASGGGYVSFGGISEGGGPLAQPNDIQLWTSMDEIHWTLADRVVRPGWMYNFGAVAGGYVGAGQTVIGLGGEQGYGPLGVWTSADGRTWQTLAGLPPIESVQVLSVVGDGIHTVVAFVDQDGILQLLVGGGI